MMKPYDYHDTDDGIDYKIDRYTVARDAPGAIVPCSLFLVHSLQCLVLVFAIRCCSSVQVGIHLFAAIYSYSKETRNSKQSQENE